MRQIALEAEAALAHHPNPNLAIATLLEQKRWDVLAQIAEILQQPLPSDMAVLHPHRFSALARGIGQALKGGWGQLNPAALRALTLKTQNKDTREA